MTKISDRVSLVLVGVLLAALSAAPATAQESRPVNIGALKLTAPVFLAAAGTPAPAPAAQAPAAAPAADPVLTFFKNTEMSGFVDFYYLYNFNTPTAQNVPLRAFDVAHNSFTMQLAELALEKKPVAENRGGYRLDFDYGPTATLVHGVGSFQNLEQAYLSYLAPVGSGLQLDFGKFVTQHGAEVIETKDNWNYSRSLLFQWAIPYHHMGMRAMYTLNDKVSVMGALVNGWNNMSDNNTGKTVGVGVTVKPSSSLTVAGNYMGGPEQPGNNSNWRNLFDATATYTASPKLSLMANYDYGREAVPVDTCTLGETACVWQGIAGYLKYQVNDWFAVSPRFEFYNDKDGAGLAFVGLGTGADQKIKEFTLTLETKHKDGVILRVEYRRDQSTNGSFFTKDAGATPSDFVGHQDTLTFGLVYAFSTKTP